MQSQDLNLRYVYFTSCQLQPVNSCSWDNTAYFSQGLSKYLQVGVMPRGKCCRLYRACPGKSKKLVVSCYERAVLIATQAKKEFLLIFDVPGNHGLT